MKNERIRSKKNFFGTNKLITAILLGMGAVISYISWCFLVYVPTPVKQNVSPFLIYGGIFVGLGILIFILRD